MTPDQFNERIAYRVLMGSEQEPKAEEIDADDPDFARKFLGWNPDGTTR